MGYKKGRPLYGEGPDLLYVAIGGVLNDSTVAVALWEKEGRRREGERVGEKGEREGMRKQNEEKMEGREEKEREKKRMREGGKRRERRQLLQNFLATLTRLQHRTHQKTPQPHQLACRSIQHQSQG